VEDPKNALGNVNGEVVRIVTPGTVIDDEQLDPKAPQYLAAALVEAERAGVAYLDVTTGEFAAAEVPALELIDELARLAPREILHDGFDPAPWRNRLGAAWTAA